MDEQAMPQMIVPPEKPFPIFFRLMLIRQLFALISLAVALPPLAFFGLIILAAGNNRPGGYLFLGAVVLEITIVIEAFAAAAMLKRKPWGWRLALGAKSVYVILFGTAAFSNLLSSSPATGLWVASLGAAVVEGLMIVFYCLPTVRSLYH